mmetsp:Transcript_165417/g.530779  ORF Transcript_165417/g.530779 Transcript_165417/m.530779 type:complete len:222 (+) Transcript_165417:654-1319(+)
MHRACLLTGVVQLVDLGDLLSAPLPHSVGSQGGIRDVGGGQGVRGIAVAEGCSVGADVKRLRVLVAVLLRECRGALPKVTWIEAKRRRRRVHRLTCAPEGPHNAGCQGHAGRKMLACASAAARRHRRQRGGAVARRSASGGRKADAARATAAPECDEAALELRGQYASRLEFGPSGHHVLADALQVKAPLALLVQSRVDGLELLPAVPHGPRIGPQLLHLR